MRIKTKTIYNSNRTNQLRKSTKEEQNANQTAALDESITWHSSGEREERLFKRQKRFSLCVVNLSFSLQNERLLSCYGENVAVRWGSSCERSAGGVQRPLSAERVSSVTTTTNISIIYLIFSTILHYNITCFCVFTF